MAGSHRVAPYSRHSPEFELENLQSHNFDESVDMPDFSDIEKKISQKMLIYENRPSHKCDQAQQTDLNLRAMSEQKEGFDNLVRNFDFMREVVRKYMRLDISSGYKHAYDQKQKDKINQKFEQKTAINIQTEKIVESLQQQMLSQTGLRSSAAHSDKDYQQEIVKYKAQIYDL